MNPADLIDSARQRAGGVRPRPGRPRQTDLQRAVSDAYYALFHTLAICCSDTLVGTGYYRQQPEWRQVYRSLEHGYARRQCGDSRIMSQFPLEIRQFAEHFANAQLQRHLADYDPDTRLGRREVLRLIDETEQIINDFNRSPFHRRRAFAVRVLFRTRAA